MLSNFLFTNYFFNVLYKCFIHRCLQSYKITDYYMGHYIWRTFLEIDIYIYCGTYLKYAIRYNYIFYNRYNLLK